MSTYFKLLTKNFIFAIVFCSFFALSGLFLLTKNAAVQQLEHQEILLSIDNQHLKNKNSENNTLAFSKSLTKLAHYHVITISDNSANKNKLVNLQESSSPLLEFILPKANQVTLPNYNVEILYQLSIKDDLTQYVNTIIMLIVLSLFLILLTTPMDVKRYKRLIDNISQQIIDELSDIISKGDKSNKTSNNDENIHHAQGKNNRRKKKNVIDLPEIQQQLLKLRTMISDKESDSIELEKQAFIEPITQLENRNRFMQSFENMQNKTERGVLSITRCSELTTINKTHGYQEGDKYVRYVADLMQQAISRYHGAHVFRLNSSDFATLLPNVTLKNAEKFAIDLTNKFNEYQQFSELNSIAYTSMVAFDNVQPLGDLLALADIGISLAHTQGVNSWFSHNDSSMLENSSSYYGNQKWRQEIDNVINNQQINLLIQPIQPTGNKSRVYSEVLTRFTNANSETLPTASFFAMAEKLDKIIAVDRMIIEEVIKVILIKNMQEQSFGINISARSMNDGHFIIWLERRLLRDTAIASKLVFEITEYSLQQNIKTSKKFIDMLHRVGARVTVEHFGTGLTSFKFFRDLKPDFVKMDSTYTRDIDEDRNNQYFLRLMVDLAHRLSINVLAESVENQDQKFALEKLFIDGCQGFYISKPSSI